MGWTVETTGNEETIVGPVGDKLCIHVTAEFDELVDFTGHTWRCTIREHATSETGYDLALDDNNSGVGVIDLLFTMDDTTELVSGKCYRWGVRAISGDHAPFTLVANGALRPTGSVVHLGDAP